MKNYVYENGFAIGYMHGDKLVLLPAPIKTSLLTD